MVKLFAVALIFASFTANQAPTLTVRLAGSEKEVAGTVVGGKDMVPLADIAKLLGAQIEVHKLTPTDRIATLTLEPPKPMFDEVDDTKIPVDGDTSTWMVVANSGGKLRVRDFIRSASSWTLQGEIDVAKGGIMVQGRPPRDTMVLSFYVVLKDANGKTLGRKNVEIANISFDGGRYPITINLSRNDGSSNLPASVGLRFNSASEAERGG